MLETNTGRVQMPAEIWRHFRDVRHVRRLGQRSGLKIVVVADEFDPLYRADYVARVLTVVESYADRSKVVLLDPDTGIEPGRATAKHVTTTEVSIIWQALRSGGWLVVYQHAARGGSWMDARRTKFANACSISGCRTFESSVARDVALFAAEKP